MRLLSFVLMSLLIPFTVAHASDYVTWREVLESPQKLAEFYEESDFPERMIKRLRRLGVSSLQDLRIRVIYGKQQFYVGLSVPQLHRLENALQTWGFLSRAGHFFNFREEEDEVTKRLDHFSPYRREDLAINQPGLLDATAVFRERKEVLRRDVLEQWTKPATWKEFLTSPISLQIFRSEVGFAFHSSARNLSELIDQGNLPKPLIDILELWQLRVNGKLNPELARRLNSPSPFFRAVLEYEEFREQLAYRRLRRASPDPLPAREMNRSHRLIKWLPRPIYDGELEYLMAFSEKNPLRPLHAKLIETMAQISQEKQTSRELRNLFVPFSSDEIMNDPLVFRIYLLRTFTAQSVEPLVKRNLSWRDVIDGLGTAPFDEIFHHIVGGNLVAEKLREEAARLAKGQVAYPIYPVYALGLPMSDLSQAAGTVNETANSEERAIIQGLRRGNARQLQPLVATTYRLRFPSSIQDEQWTALARFIGTPDQDLERVRQPLILLSAGAPLLRSARFMTLKQIFQSLDGIEELKITLAITLDSQLRQLRAAGISLADYLVQSAESRHRAGFRERNAGMEKVFDYIGWTPDRLEHSSLMEQLRNDPLLLNPVFERSINVRNPGAWATLIQPCGLQLKGSGFPP